MGEHELVKQQISAEVPWHALPPRAIADLLNVDLAVGLADEEAARRPRDRWLFLGVGAGVLLQASALLHVDRQSAPPYGPTTDLGAVSATSEQAPFAAAHGGG